MVDIGTLSLIILLGMFVLLSIGMPLGFASAFLAVVPADFFVVSLTTFLATFLGGDFADFLADFLVALVVDLRGADFFFAALGF